MIVNLYLAHCLLSSLLLFIAIVMIIGDDAFAELFKI